MSGKNGISWTDRTWNPVAGCSLVSPGCRNCYAMKMARRLEAMGVDKYRGLTKIEKGQPVWTGKIRMADEATIESIRKWKSPRLVFVNSMSDLFHAAMADEDIFRLLDLMKNESRHRFQILTKRPQNMLRALDIWMARRSLDMLPDHLWFGVSVEDQKRADERIPLLAAVRAKIRFVSMEPLIERVELRHLPRVEWYIVGGESAPRKRARRFDPDWARDIRDAVYPAAFHMKQFGSNPVGISLRHQKGADLREFPDDLRIVEWPE